VKVDIATENNWEDCKRLRLEEISGEDSEMFGYITEKDLESERQKNKEDWKRRLTSGNQFCVLAQVESKAVGLGNAIEKENNLWRIRWGYIEKDFRNQDLHKKIIILRLKEILKRGGKMVESGVVAKNANSLKNLQSIGFKINEKHKKNDLSDDVYSYTMLLDLTDEEVIKKINDFVV
jgi:hypothetical protein